MRIDAPIITGSFSLNGDTFNDLGAYTTTGSNTFIGDQIIVGAVSASALTGSISYTNLTNVPTLVSGSDQVVSILSSLNSYTQSNDTTNTTQNSRLTSLEEKTGSLASTGSNTFYGTQTISGTVYIANDLIVQGSSSIQYITGSSVNIGTNIVSLNTAFPSVRYAGLTMVDSGSVGGSGSFLYDSMQDEFIFVHRGDGTNVTSSHFVLGPETYNNLGNETYLTCNRIPKGTGKEHLVDSCIYESGGCVGINTNSPSYTLDISGSIGRIKNTGGSADFILDRASTSAGATRQYSTAGTLNWYTGLRGLVNNNFYIFNNSTSTNSLIIDETTNNATFACGISVGNTATFSNCIIAGGDTIVCNNNIKTFSNTYGSTGLLRMYGTDGCEKYQQGLTTGGDFYQYTFAGLNHIFYTNGTNERMRISCAGNISIGRSDQMYKLNVFNDVSKTCTTARGLAFFGSNDALASAPFGLVITSQGGATVGDRIVRMGTTDFGLVNGGTLELNGVLFICNSGNVGIRHGSPENALHVCINCASSGITIAQFENKDYTAGTRSYVRVRNWLTAGGSYSSYFGQGQDGKTYIYANNTARCGDIVIDGATGNVGIGTNAPSLLLHIHSNTGDYNTVFSSNCVCGRVGFVINRPGSTTAIASALVLASDCSYRLGTSSYYNIKMLQDGSTTILSTTEGDALKVAAGGAVSINTGTSAVDASNQRLQVYGAIRQDVLGVSYGEGMIMNFPANGTNYGGLFLHSTATAMAAVGASSIKWGINYNYTPEGGVGAGNLAFVNANTTTMMDITSGGCVYIGKGWGATNHRINLQKPQGCTILVVSGYSGSNNDSLVISAASGAGYNGALTVLGVTTNSSSGRSISAGGTINASGGDYAEYMLKRNDAGCIAKGQIVGIDSCKLLTDKWSLANSFVIKSTDPSYVGGDIWDKHIGNRPQQTTDITDEQFAPILAEYEAKLEEARNKVDRIAFSGQVPVIVSGSYNVGDYILPIEGPDDTIIGVACSLSSLTLEDYGKTVGKVWGSCLDKAWVAVKIG